MDSEAYVFRTNPWLVARPVVLLLAVGMPVFMGIDYWIFGRQLIRDYPHLWLYALVGYPFGMAMAAFGGWGLYRLAYFLADQTVTVDARGIRIKDWTGAERGYRWEEIEDSNLWRRRSALQPITLTVRGRRHLLFNYLQDYARCGEVIAANLARVHNAA